MITYFIIFSVAIVFFFAWWFKLRTPGLPREQKEIEAVLYELLQRGYANGYLLLTEGKSKKFIQFYKYLDKETSGIVLSIPDANWNKPYINKIVEYADEQSLKTNQVESMGDDGIDFIDIDLKSDISLASKVTKHILNNIYGIGYDEKINVRLENASLRDYND